MSRTPLPFAPDPHKWIDTSSSSKSRKSQLQRPLMAMGLQKGYATPPLSTLRRTRDREDQLVGQGQVDTPRTRIGGRQAGLSSWMTPPTTVSEPRRRFDRLRKDIAKELNENSTPTLLGGKGKGKTTVKSVDDFWGSDDMPQEPQSGPSRTAIRSRSPSRSRSRSRSRSTSVEFLPAAPAKEAPSASHRISPRLSRLSKSPHSIRSPIHSQSRSRGRSLRPFPSQPQPIPSSHLPHLSPSPPSPPSLPKTSSPGFPTPSKPTTPIPDHILDIHRQLCGQDSNRTKRVRSPWRSKDKERTPPLSPPPKDLVKQVDRRIKAKVHDKENTSKGRPGKEAKGLVVLSDDDEELQQAPPAGVLRSLNPNVQANASLGKWQKSFVMDCESPKKRKLAKTGSGIEYRTSGGVTPRSKKIATRPTTTAVATAEVQRSPSPLRTTRSKPTALPPVPPPTSSPQPPHPVTPHEPLPYSPTTPRKRHDTSPHHKVTPPKSKNLRRITPDDHGQDHLFEQNETLFAFPPPRQPVFQDVRPRKEKEWRPVDMEAETLMTWSLGQHPRQSNGPAEVDKDIMMAEPQPERTARPEATPLQALQGTSKGKHRHSSSGGAATSETESTPDQLPPSDASQSFPHLVRSSPPRISRGDIPTVKQQDAKLYEPSSPSHRPAQPAARKAEDRWQALNQGILSVPIPQPISTPTTSKTASGSGRKPGIVPKSKTSSSQQPKLAAFGFFPSQSKDKVRDEVEVFDRTWDEEEDLEMGGEGQDQQLNQDTTPVTHAALRNPRAGGLETPTPRNTITTKGLNRIPDAPYHPDLRPAGIREIMRRKRIEEGDHIRDDDDGMSDDLRKTDLPGRAEMPGGSGSDSSQGKSDRTMPTSSVTSSELLQEEDMDLIEAARQAREWFEGIESRRSSDYGRSLL